MLRAWLIGIIAVFLAVLPGLVMRSDADGFWVRHFWHDILLMALWPVILLLGLVFERIRYKNEIATPPGPDWVATEECTVDESGTVRVWYHPGSGERAYVREQSGKLS